MTDRHGTGAVAESITRNVQIPELPPQDQIQCKNKEYLLQVNLDPSVCPELQQQQW